MPKTEPKPIDRLPVDKAKANGNAPSFVRCELSADMKRQLEGWALELEDMDLWKWVCDMVTRGYTISIRSNEVGYQCSVTGVTESSGNKDKCLVSRASTPHKSLQSAMFKTTVILESLWPASRGLDELDF